MHSLDDRTITVSPSEVAQRLGVTLGTLANWRFRGDGPRYIKVGGKVRYRLIDVAEWLEGQGRRSTSDPGPLPARPGKRHRSTARTSS